MAGVFPAHEGLRARVHDGVDHAQCVGLPLEDPAVQIELRRAHRQRVLEHHAVRRAGARQPGLHHALEGLDQAADDPQFAPAESCVRVQFRPCLLYTSRCV